jgi:GxxExxY protein
MTENEVAKIIVDVAFKIHTSLGPGLLESVYEAVMAHELKNRGLQVERQVPIPFAYEGLSFDEGFRADLIVENLVIIELKSVEEIHPVHPKQLLAYLKLSHKRLGLLINFNVPLIKHGINRIVNGLPDEDIFTQRRKERQERP